MEGRKKVFRLGKGLDWGFGWKNWFKMKCGGRGQYQEPWFERFLAKNYVDFIDGSLNFKKTEISIGFPPKISIQHPIDSHSLNKKLFFFNWVWDFYIFLPNLKCKEKTFFPLLIMTSRDGKLRLTNVGCDSKEIDKKNRFLCGGEKISTFLWLVWWKIEICGALLGLRDNLMLFVSNLCYVSTLWVFGKQVKWELNWKWSFQSSFSSKIKKFLWKNFKNPPQFPTLINLLRLSQMLNFKSITGIIRKREFFPPRNVESLNM